MKIGVIGGGVVGRATARAFIEHVDEVRVYDVVKERRTHTLHEALDTDLVFVCLPTPQKDGGRACDVSALDAFFGTHVNLPCFDARRANFVLRSTVPVGTTWRLREQYGLPGIVHSPEFLTARCAATDAQLPARNIIGQPERVCGYDCAKVLSDLYKSRFPGVPVHHMTSDESEAVKLIQNSFFAVKVAFMNEARHFADAAGLDWDRVLEAVLADGRISHSHTKVPGPDGKRGFGGHCLPKDLANLITCIESLKLSAAVTKAAYERNECDRAGGCKRAGILDDVDSQEIIRRALARDMV